MELGIPDCLFARCRTAVTVHEQHFDIRGVAQIPATQLTQPEQTKSRRKPGYGQRLAVALQEPLASQLHRFIHNYLGQSGQPLA